MKKLFFLMLCLLSLLVMAGCGDEKKADSTPVKVEKIKQVEMVVPKGVPVLMYHKVGEDKDNDAVIREDLFRAQMEYLKKNDYHPITLDELADYLEKGTPLPVRPVVLTFDDGYKDTYTIVYPLLKKLGFVGTVFVNPGDIGTRLTWQELEEMKKGGMMIASHGYDHVEMNTLTDKGQKENLEKAQKALKEKLDIDNKWFCYPYGEHNAFSKAELKRQGFRGAVKMNGGWAHAGEDLYAINRLWVGNAVTLEHFAERVSTDKYKDL